MDDNEFHVPACCSYVWPIVSKEGGLPGPDRYDSFKAAKGVYVNEFVMLSGTSDEAAVDPDAGDPPSSSVASFFETVISAALSAVVVITTL
jgi:hypothetical protein